MDLYDLKSQITTSPAFIINADIISDNLKQLLSIKQQTDCKVLFSIKSLPLTAVLELALPFVDGFSVSSLFEAKLADEVLKKQGELHLTTPGIRDDEIINLDALCSHISFNSLSQYQRLSFLSPNVSKGLRVNPKLSFLKDERFNPCRLHSKLGVDIDELNLKTTPCDGLHFHTVFSATQFTPLLKTLEKLQQYLGEDFKQLKWLNLGGGYLFSQIKDFTPLIDGIQKIKNQQETEIYLEPGKAIVGDAGYLLTTVIDCFQSDGKQLAVLDTSINHNPEVFEYQRRPLLVEENINGKYSFLLAGSTCLAGDMFGEYRFNRPLKVGDKLVFKQMGAYSLIKANRFNGYNLPDIYWFKQQNCIKIKQYNYHDYQQQWTASGKI